AAPRPPPNCRWRWPRMPPCRGWPPISPPAAPHAARAGREKTGDGTRERRYTGAARRAPAQNRSPSSPQQTMPITILDIALLAVMLLSGLLAMIRGFMREILSIAAWAAAAVATLMLYQRLLPVAKQYFNNDIVAA